VAIRTLPYQAFVGVMRGCHHRCSYCVVPRTRGGREESRPILEVVDEVRELADDGVLEVTLLGQNINSYGRSLADRPKLSDLLEKVHEVGGIERIRFVTSNPMDLEAELLEAMGALPKVMEYLHFPAQSGSNEVLRRMFRGYTRERYLELAAMARELVPGIELASDFIVGFPGETEADFEETVDLMERVRFQNCYVFKYSPRPKHYPTTFRTSGNASGTSDCWPSRSATPSPSTRPVSAAPTRCWWRGSRNGIRNG
jgi:tRNA-2-methylthio-N6-dimethylallyladenosine synthase